MSSRHLVCRAADAIYEQPLGWAAGATGYRRWNAIGEHTGSAHTAFGMCSVEPGGSVPAHVHSFEETFYIHEGFGVIDMPDGAHQVGPGDYGLIPVGTPHAWRNDGAATVTWAEMQGPAPRSRHGDDTFLVPAGSNYQDAKREAHGRIHVIAVTSFAQALRVIRALPPR